MFEEELYFGSWECVDDLVSDFQDKRVLNYTILIAAYSDDGNDGSCCVIAEKDGVLYEVSASHCSCMGLEGTWEPDEITKKYLKNRLVNGSFGQGNDFDEALRQLVLDA